MILGLHSAVVDVADLEVAARDYTRLIGCEPLRIESHPGARTRSAFFGLANMMLELREEPSDTHSERADGKRGRKFGQAGFRLRCEDEVGEDALVRRGVALASTLDEEALFEGGGGRRRWRSRQIDSTSSRGLSVELVSHEVLEPVGIDAPPRSSVDPAARIRALDHLVVMSPDPEGTRAFYGDGLGIRLALDKTFEERGVRLLFFRVGGTTIEIGARVGADPRPDRRDAFGGLAWQVVEIDAIQARLAGDGFDVSEIRSGNKPGTRVCTVRDPVHSVPTLLIEPVAA